MKRFEDLVDKTKTFFERHWNPTYLPTAAPSWSEPYRFVGTWPNDHQQGCYAFFRNQEVVYVGVAASSVGGNYLNCGIANRSSYYMQVNIRSANSYKFRDNKWQDIEELRTIGFAPAHSYLSYALEVFLIGQLDPSFNKTHMTGKGENCQ
jgi:hypothetical protein